MQSTLIQLSHTQNREKALPQLPVAWPLVEHAFNPNIQETEEGRALHIPRPASDT